MSIEKISRLAANCFENNPVIVMGSGASMAYGLPSMSMLAHYLREHITVENAAQPERWTEVLAKLDKNYHLEAALEGINLSDSLLKQIVKETWECINEIDRNIYIDIASGEKKPPLSKMLNTLFQSTNMAVHVVTTNYDRIIEYVSNSAGFHFSTGFSPGYINKWDESGGVNHTKNLKNVRTVKIWKVHGSLDWFQMEDERVIGLPVFELPDPSLSPLIVTPGLNKYKRTYQDPFRSVINGADAALRGARAFLTVGFGFRDEHIHPKIIEKCRIKNVPIVVLARSLTEEAKDFLVNKAGQNYLGIEESNGGSMAYTIDHPEGYMIEGKDYWSAEGFLDLVT